jgi:hypothetical protein
MHFSFLSLVIGTAALVAVVHGGDDQPKEYVKVEIKGVLHTGIVAIGGETTGYVVKVDGVAWELDFAKHPELKEAADKLDKQTIIATGDYVKKTGVEVPVRNLVVVATIAAAN